MPLLLLGIFSVFQILLFLIHAAVYQSMATAFGIGSTWLAWLFGLLSLTFVGASLLAHRYSNAAATWFYRASAYWFGLILFLFAGALVFYFTATILYHYDVYISPALLCGVSLIGFFLFHSYATWRTRIIQIKKVKIELPHGKWPTAWLGKKIVFVSDLHLGAVWARRRCEEFVRVIAAQSPEMVLIGGDIFDGPKCNSRELLAPFVKLHPPRGVYFASGNHEYYSSDPEILFADIAHAGMRVLRNEAVRVDGIQLIGVDWKDTEKKHNFEKILAGAKIDHAVPSILLRHEPSHLEIAERAGISLTLSGHTHAGQIFPLRYVTRSIYRGLDYGLNILGKMMVCTSSGVGTWGPPLRLGTRSEIVVIELH